MLFLQEGLNSIDTNSLKRFVFLHLFRSNHKGLCVVNDLLYDQDSYLDPPKKEVNFIVLKVKKKKKKNQTGSHLTFCLPLKLVEASGILPGITSGITPDIMSGIENVRYIGTRIARPGHNL